MDIRGSSAIVTGGASGLGAATVKRIVDANGAALIFDSDAKRSAALCSELGKNVDYFAGDVCDEADVNEALEMAASKAPLRLVVNCAGIGLAERSLSKDNTPHSLASFDRVIRVNLVGTFNVLRLGSRVMSISEPLNDDERGVIVNTASIAAYDGQIGQIAYAASKGGIVSMTLPAARDLSAVGIRVVTVAPGLMDTPLLGQLPEQMRITLGSSVPFPQRLGLPEDFSSLVMEIVRNRYINGEVIRLDGALRMPPK